MESFALATFAEKLTAARGLETKLRDSDRHPDDVQVVGQAASLMPDTGWMLESLGLAELAQRCHDVFARWRSDKGLSRAEALYAYETFFSELQRELRRPLLLVVLEADKRYYETPMLSKLTASSFPAAGTELAEAAKCLALSRPTACVFHCMRALEHGLDALAYRLQVPNPRRDWYNLIDLIEKKVSVFGAKSGKKQTAARRRLLESCAKAALHFRVLKDAWRNHTIHGRANHDRAKALEVLQHVSSFFEELCAGDIKERPRRG